MILVLLLIYFSVLHAQKIKIKTENGIQVVYNPKDPAPPPGTPNQLILTEELSIGDEEIEDYIYSNIFSFDVDDEGNIYVLDTKEACVKVFDKNGKRIRTFGEKGQGPGEMQVPVGLSVVAGKEIMTYDTANYRLTYYSLNGQYIRQVIAGQHMFALTIPDSRGNIVGLSLIFGEEPIYKIMKFDQDLNPTLTIKTLPAEGFRSGVLRMVRPATIVRVTSNDHIAWGISSKYEIHIVSPKGEMVRKIIKDYTPVKISKEEKYEWMQSYEDQNLPLGYKLETANHHNPFRYFMCGADGRIYSGTYEKDTEGNFYYDVFDAQGRYVAKFSLPKNEIILHVKMNKMYILIRENEESIPVVKRYGMRWE
jgi:outer membrane protein assembly factor BamB